MNCSINSASNFSGLQAGMSPISLVQSAVSVRSLLSTGRLFFLYLAFISIHEPILAISAL